MLLYHGTGFDRLDSIMKEGIKPTDTYEMTTAFTKKFIHRYFCVDKCVHLTPVKKFAEFYAVASHDYLKGNVVLVVDADRFVKKENIMFNTNGAEMKIEETIPPECIVGVEHITPIIESWTFITSKKFIYF